jgi:hypothetical protein
VLLAVRRHIWWILVPVSVLIGLFGISDALVGATADPAIARGLTGRTLAELEGESAAAYRMYDFTSRSQGTGLAVIGVLTTAILLVPYRSGRRWAWSVMWAIPTWAFSIPVLYLLFGVDPRQPPPPPLVSGPVLGSLTAAVLLFDRGRFFGGSRDAGDGEALR